MKALYFILFLTSTVFCASAQYIAPQGRVHFHSSAPLEDIDAISSEGHCSLNTSSKKVIAKVEIKSFVFSNALMQLHFNENYMESDKFPFAILDAEIISKVSFKKDGLYKITLKGNLEVHGVKQQRTIAGQLIVKDGQPEKATAEFDVRLEDHNIKVPTAIVKKIAEVIKVDVNFVFNKIL